MSEAPRTLRTKRIAVPGVLMALCLGRFACPDIAAAEGEIGLEAQGVSPWSALRNRWKLDVRDEMNRPVSGRIIERQLKAAAAQAAAETALSPLPEARRVVQVLEVFAGWTLALRAPPPRPGPRAPAAAGASRPPQLPLLVVIFFVLSTCLPFRRGRRSRPLDFQIRSLLVLRC